MTVGLNPRGQYTLDSHPKDSIVLRRARHHLLHELFSSLIFTCKIFYLYKLLGLGHFFIIFIFSLNI